MADTHKYSSINKFRHLCLITRHWCATWHMPRYAIIIGIDRIVAKRLCRCLTDSCDKHNATSWGNQAIAGAEERGTPCSMFRHDTVGAKDKISDVFRLGPCLTIIVTPCYIRAYRIWWRWVPQSYPTDEPRYQAVIIVSPSEHAVTEAMVIPSTLCNSIGFAPSMTAIGTSSTHDINIFRQVTLIILTFVGDSDYWAVFRSDHTRYPIISGVIITRLKQQGVGKNYLPIARRRRVHYLESLRRSRDGIQFRIDDVAFCSVISHLYRNPQIVHPGDNLRIDLTISDI